MSPSRVNSGVKTKKIFTVKIQKISEITATLPFTEFDFVQKYREGFRQSELGRIHGLLPLKELAAAIAEKMPAKNPQGNKPMFSPEGEVALMFLKPYTGMSDDVLVEMLNGNIYMQMFCDVLIDPEHPIKDGKIVSAIRNRIAKVIKIKDLQKILYDSWKGEIKNPERFMTDATCYESRLRFPTDVKLLWECCEWLYALYCKFCRKLGENRPRNKYHEVDSARLAYAKQRRHTREKTRSLIRRLLKLLSKMLGQWFGLFRRHRNDIRLSKEQQKRLEALCKVRRQQRDLFAGRQVSGRIVSIDRPYIRPIKRGKENNAVEFGAKVNMIQMDGISFIEHHSFDNFNEGIRLEECIRYHKELTGLDASQIGADTIYANNKNRILCTKNGIKTNFARKGPRPRDEDADLRTTRKILGNMRSTVMEGSFGNQKQHYAADRIPARNEFSETLMLFFSVHMANAATLAARKLAREQREAQKRKKNRA